MIGVPTVLVDMPQTLLRMKIGHDNSLEVLEKVFNDVCN
jgi:hypothetical protein